MFAQERLDVRGPLLPDPRRDQRPAAGPGRRPADHRRRRRASSGRCEIAAQHADMTHWFPIGREVLARKTELLARHCEAIGRDPSTIERTMQAPGRGRRDDAERAKLLRAVPAGAPAARHRRQRRAVRRGPAPVPRRRVHGLHVQQHRSTETPEQIALVGELLKLVAAPTPREAVPLPRRARGRRRRQGARRGRAPGGVDRLRRLVYPDHVVLPFGLVPLLDDGRGRHRTAAGRGRSWSTTTCATRRCSPRTWRRST